LNIVERNSAVEQFDREQGFAFSSASRCQVDEMRILAYLPLLSLSRAMFNADDFIASSLGESARGEIDWARMVANLNATLPSLFSVIKCTDQRYTTQSKTSGRYGWTNQHADIIDAFQWSTTAHGASARIPTCCMVTRGTFLETYHTAFAKPDELPLSAFYNITDAFQFWRSLGAYREETECPETHPAPPPIVTEQPVYDVWNFKNPDLMAFLSLGLVHFDWRVEQLADEICAHMPAFYVGLHLRWEYDMCCHQGLGVDFYDLVLHRLPPRSTVYVASGLYEPGKEEAVYNQRVRQLWSNLVDRHGKQFTMIAKHDILSFRGRQLLRELPLEIHAQVDFLVLVRSSLFVGNTETTTMAMNVAYIRSLVRRNSLVSSIDWRLLPWLRHPTVTPFMERVPPKASDVPGMFAMQWSQEFCDSMSRVTFEPPSDVAQQCEVCRLIPKHLAVRRQQAVSSRYSDSSSGGGGEDVSLRELFRKHNTDKGYTHHYERQYERLLAPFRYQPVRLLEIGADGGASMAVWRDYFSDAELLAGIGYGAGFNANAPACKSAVHCYYGDQANVTFLDWLLVDSGGRFDVIIDDGSHLPEHQFASLRRLLERDALVDGGLYIIEDVETSYWRPGSTLYGYEMRGTGLHGACSFVERMKPLVDVVNRRFIHANFTTMSTAVDRRIESLEFSQNMIVMRMAHIDSERWMGAAGYPHQQLPAQAPVDVVDWPCKRTTKRK
jgi:hypothetical protein